MRIVRPDHRAGILPVGHQPLHGVEHVPVAQVPAGAPAPIHRPVVAFRSPHDARVLFGVKIRLAILRSVVGDQLHPLRQQLAQLGNDRLFAPRQMTMLDRLSIFLWLILPACQAAIAAARFCSGSGIMGIKIGDHGMNGFPQAVDIKPAHARARRLRHTRVVLA